MPKIASKKSARSGTARKVAAPKRAVAKPVAKKKARAKSVARTTTQARPRRAGSARKLASRADLGAPIDGFFARQPPQLRAILEELRKLVETSVPGAEASIKWGMPFYTLGGAMFCALGGHKSHVNLVLAGPPAAFADPEGRLDGNSKTGRHLRLTQLEDLPRERVRTWVRAAAAIARTKN